MANAFDPAQAEALAPAERALIERRHRLLGPAYRLFYDRPIHLIRGEGAWLFDAAGERYLDAYNNVAQIGHCHPAVVSALAAQAATLNTHTRYLHARVLDYAERLLALFEPPLAHVMFTCTGSEANDLALRIARAHTGGSGVVVSSFAYHGVTAALVDMSPGLGAPLGTHVRAVPPPGPGVSGVSFAAEVAAAFADLAEQGIQPAALLLDTIFASDGLVPDALGQVAPAVVASRDAGALFIADEVQPGFGRTGAHMWGFARHGLAPDIVTLGKPMGDGHPIGGLVARADVLGAFGQNMRYFNTFGGNPVSAEVGLAVLDVIEREGLRKNAVRQGTWLLDKLKTLAGRDARLGNPRGAGLFLAVDVVDRDGRPDRVGAARIVNGLRERRVLISAAGPHGHALKIRPPLCLDDEQAALLIATLDATLKASN